MTELIRRGRGTLFGRLSALEQELVGSSSVLAAQTAIIAVSGFVFWLVAARSHPAEAIGAAAGLFTLTVVGDYASALGLPIVVARFASSRSAGASTVFVAALLVSAIGSAIAATIISAVASATFAPGLIRHGRLVAWLLMFISVNGQAWTTLLDNYAIARDRGRGVVLRHGAVAASRIALVSMPLVGPDELWIWMAGTLLPLAAVGAGLAIERRALRLGERAPVANWGPIARFGLVNWVSTLGALAPFVILPLVVFSAVDSRSNATFHIAWSIAAVAFLVPNIVSRALLLRGDDQGAIGSTQVDFAVKASALLCLAISVVTIPAAFLLPLVYGDAYTDSSRLLVLLIAALVPYSLSANMLSAAQILRDTRQTLLIAGGLVVAVVVPGAIAVPRYGATGVSVCWLIGHVLCGLVAAAMILRLRGAGYRTGVIG